MRPRKGLKKHRQRKPGSAAINQRIDYSRPYLFIPTNTGDIKVMWDDIQSCEGSGSYTTLHLRNKTKLENLSFNLADFERNLPGKFFFRIHKSWIVHLDHIKKFITDHV